MLFYTVQRCGVTNTPRWVFGAKKNRAHPLRGPFVKAQYERRVAFVGANTRHPAQM